MLILSRKMNQQIRIGDDIVLTVLKVKGNKVRLGIEAPREVEVVRAELLEDNDGSSPARQARILIVDDSAEDREVVRRFLSRSGTQQYSFSESEGGEDGLVRCRQEVPDCVVLDFKMPDLDGLEFLGKLRGDEASRHIPVILLTGEGNEKLAHAAIAQGAQAYLTKDDVSPELLQQLVYHAVRMAHPN
jgi:carbon storage regulator CsrA